MIKKVIFKKSIAILLVLGLIWSCGKDDDGGTPPVLQNNAPKIQAQSFNASEVVKDTTVIGKVAATDADNDALTFSIKTNSNALFEITNSGDISLATGKFLDFKTAKSHTLSIAVTDGVATVTETVTIDVTEASATVSSVAGFTAGNTDGTGASAQFNSPIGIIVNETGTSLDVVDRLNKSVRTVNVSTGAVNTKFSSNDFGLIRGIVASNANTYFLADSQKHVIWKASFVTTPVAEWQISIFAGSEGDSGLVDGTGSSARFNAPSGLDIDSSGNLYVADKDNRNVRKITPARNVTTLITQADPNSRPEDVAVAPNGTVYFTDVKRHYVGKITSAGQIIVIAGSPDEWGNTDGLFASARLEGPSGITIDGNFLYVVSNINNNVKRIALDTNNLNNKVTTIAGSDDKTAGDSDGDGSSARFRNPIGVTIDATGNLYITDTNNQRIRKITVQ